MAIDVNARLREHTPEGFARDDTHRPPVTLLQTYVAEEELDAELATVERVAAEVDVATLRIRAVGLYRVPSGEIGLAGIVIEPTPELLAVQDAFIVNHQGKVYKKDLGPRDRGDRCGDRRLRSRCDPDRSDRLTRAAAVSEAIGSADHASVAQSRRRRHLAIFRTGVTPTAPE